jgi:hypothetical protein
MITNRERTSPFTDINGLVADFLDDVGDRPVPRGAKARLDEIRQAVTQGKGTVQMALDIIEMFPNNKTAYASDRLKQSNRARSAKRGSSENSDGSGVGD